MDQPTLPPSWLRSTPVEPLPSLLAPPQDQRAGGGVRSMDSTSADSIGARQNSAAPARPVVYPAGLAVLASVQFLIAGLIIVMVLLLPPSRLAGGSRAMHQAAAAWPALILLASAAGLVLRKGWGWRLTATLFWFLTGNPVFDLVASLVEHKPFPLAVNAIVLAVAVGALVYLNGAARMAVFGFGEASSIARARPLPMVAGVSAAAIRCLATVLG